ncbi:Mitochondrial import inner membrane translocase subunit tim8 [Nothophoma quercina]|uniref:Mitochondrial import inner membrane translocase subunit tim8 n=1 Tax=Nothophoma quercina TaxID=749835 RepID=A0ABR3RBU1_9PLEO
MRPGSFISYALLLAPAVCRVVPLPPQQSSICNLTSLVKSINNRDAEVEPPSEFSIFAANPPPGGFTPFFDKYRCRGHKLLKACMFGEDRAREFVKRIDTSFDSTLEKELALWGYTENEMIADSQCEFDLSFELEFKALGIKAESKENDGPNECFWWQHWDDDKKDESGKVIPKEKQTYVVNDKTYRSTGARAIIGANAKDGIIYLLNHKSAYEGAKELWGVESPPADELPQLTDTSDMAWGVWRRVHPDGQKLDKIKMFFSVLIINKITQQLISEALKTYKVAAGQSRVSSLPRWPGLTFDLESAEGKAMLGSPNGIAVGYFLAQHKNQLGGNKYVTKAQVWADQLGSTPSIIFYVANAPAQPPEEPDEDIWNTRRSLDGTQGLGNAVKRSADGKNVIREHIILAKL